MLVAKARKLKRIIWPSQTPPNNSNCTSYMVTVAYFANSVAKLTCKQSRLRFDICFADFCHLLSGRYRTSADETYDKIFMNLLDAMDTLIVQLKKTGSIPLLTRAEALKQHIQDIKQIDPSLMMDGDGTAVSGVWAYALGNMDDTSGSGNDMTVLRCDLDYRDMLSRIHESDDKHLGTLVVMRVSCLFQAHLKYGFIY